MGYQRGITSRQEQDPRQLVRDTRSLRKRFLDAFDDPRAVAFFYFICGFSIFLFKGISDLIFIMVFGVFLFALTRHPKLPFRMPMISKLRDYNDLKPGTKKKPNMARGIYLFGNEKETKQEIWFNNEDMRTHVLIFGSTGSGKTETLKSLAYNALLQASGFIYVDGKGDNSLFASLFSLVRSMGREDDLLLINFMTGARDVIGRQKARLSNTMNPFASGSSSMLSQLVVSLMDSSGSSSDGDMWKGRAIGFVEALMKVMVTMRDQGHILLDANTIRNYFHLERLESMVIDKVFVRDNDESVNLEDLPKVVLEPITNYVFNLPGYNKAKKGKQVSQVLEQHGFITMQLTRVFTSLADTYGHIMRTPLAEVDMQDVVLNRRILIVLLPALEKSPDELANLGKVVIASMKAMMAAGLGDGVEGDYADLIETKPTTAKTPYLCILDEYGYYAVEGFSVVPAQARSLGFSVVFAGQDLPAFQKASKEEAASIGANTNIKICMKLEDPMETWEFFQKTGGETYVSQVETFSMNAMNPMCNYSDNSNARLEKRQRVDLLDLKEQGVGEMHIFFKSQIIRAKSLFVDPKPVKTLGLNHFLKVGAPSDASIKKQEEANQAFAKLIKKDQLIDAKDLSGQMPDLLKKLKQANNNKYRLADLTTEALLSMQNVSTPSAPRKKVTLSNQTGQVNIFTAINDDPKNDELLLADNVVEFKQPMLSKQQLRDQIQYVERLAGRDKSEATKVAMELLRDIKKSTDYPKPPEETIPQAAALASAINMLSQAIDKKVNEGG